MSIALITGGAIGLGRSFANKLADEGYDLILVSRSLDHLARAQKEIQIKYKVKVLIYIADLTKREDREKMFEYAKVYQPSVIVNNAGFGHNESFISSPLEKEFEMIDLNVKALHHIMKYYYQQFKTENIPGRIINISSVAGFVPGAYQATYYATKSYVTSLTRAVAYESKKQQTGIQIQVVCPGPIKTNFHETAQTRVEAYKKSPDATARIALESKKTVIVPGFSNKCAHVMLKLLPNGLTIRAQAILGKKKQIEK